MLCSDFSLTSSKRTLLVIYLIRYAINDNEMQKLILFEGSQPSSSQASSSYGGERFKDFIIIFRMGSCWVSTLYLMWQFFWLVISLIFDNNLHGALCQLVGEQQTRLVIIRSLFRLAVLIFGFQSACECLLVIMSRKASQHDKLKLIFPFEYLDVLAGSMSIHYLLRYMRNSFDRHKPQQQEILRKITITTKD